MNITNTDPGTQAFFSAFQKATDELDKAKGRLMAAAEAKDQAGIFQAQQDIQEQTQMMSMLTNLSQTIHNILMKLIEKLSVRM
ncbi:MAG: hypothetical protein ACO3XO_00635 [Bdellovibrionota bacterium]|jgi:CBS domain containing-hemolysin-like protein